MAESTSAHAKEPHTGWYPVQGSDAAMSKPLPHFAKPTGRSPLQKSSFEGLITAGKNGRPDAHRREWHRVRNGAWNAAEHGVVLSD